MRRGRLELEPGDVVGISYRGVRHEGLVTEPGDENTARVAHASKRRRIVAEEDAATFRAGRPIERVARSSSPTASIGYARSTLGRPWTPIHNCQAWAREVAGTAHRSPDADRGVLLLAAAVAGAVLLRHRRRGLGL